MTPDDFLHGGLIEDEDGAPYPERVQAIVRSMAQEVTTLREGITKRGDLADALLRACLYLDGFVWLHDPEASELEDMKTTAALALGCKTWEQAKELAELREARRG